MRPKQINLSTHGTNLCSNIENLVRAVELFQWTTTTVKTEARDRFGDVLKATYDLESAAKNVPQNECWKTAELICICERAREDLRLRGNLGAFLRKIQSWAGSFGEMEDPNENLRDILC